MRPKAFLTDSLTFTGDGVGVFEPKLDMMLVKLLI